MPTTVTAANIPAFKPPTPSSLETPDVKEARETAERIQAGKAPGVTGYTVAHDMVGPWEKGRTLNPDEVMAHFKGHEDTTDFIDRLVGLGALVPAFG